MKNLNKMKIAGDMQFEIGQDKISHFADLSVKDDSTLHKKLDDMKHSTFDLSKFTVVGSPTITNDGVASGFSSVNYINSYLSLNPTSKLVVKSRAVFDNSNARAQIIFRLYNPAVCRITANHYGFQMWCNNAFSSLTKTLNNGDIIDIESIYETNKQTYYITVNGVTTQVNGAITCSLANINLTKVVLGVYSANDVNYYFNGSIDLKHFSITVDGKEVFNGNKTGIDVIKPDNYTVVGSPVISDDGVASGFSSSNYLTIPSIDISKPFKFSGTFTTGADILHSQAVFGGTFESAQVLILGVHVDGYPIIYYPRTDGDSWIILSRIVSANTTYHYTLTFDGTNLTFNLTDGASYNLTMTPTNFDASKLGILSLFYIGRNVSGTYVMQPDTTIDLNSFKIYVDDNLVYQPCLKIPYTQSKTGSKIVDDVYRERVQDMYEQCGYTHYYTIGENDFTLATCKGSDVVVQGEAEGIAYTKTADLTLTQRGNCTSGSVVNLLPYKDENSYHVSSPYTAKTSNSFTPSADGDFIAVGKCYL